MNEYTENKIKQLQETEQQHTNEKNHLYINSGWVERCDLSDEEIKTGRASQIRLIKYLFDDIILANSLAENLIANDYSMSEIISPYDEENEEYYDEYQYFIVDLALDEDATINAIKRANTDLYLRYSNDNDIYILSVGNLGMSRDYIMTDLFLTTDYDLHNATDDIDE